MRSGLLGLELEHFRTSLSGLWVIIHVFCLFATKQTLGQHFLVVLRLNQAFQKTPSKVIYLIFSNIELRFAIENKMSINNSYVVPDIFIVIEEVLFLGSDAVIPQFTER